MASKYVFITTPKGTASYPYLSRVDTEFDEEGKFSVKLICENSPKVQKLIEQLDAAMEDHVSAMKAQGIKKPKIEGTMYEEDEEKGTVQFNINMKRFAGMGENKFEKVIKFFDAKGKFIGSTKELSELPTIFSGSEIAVNMRLFTWKNKQSVGIRLEPEAVQLIKLVEGTRRGAEDHGFGTYDDGYESDEEEFGKSDEEEAPKASRKAPAQEDDGAEPEDF